MSGPERRGSQDSSSHQGAKKTAGVPGKVAKPYRLDAELTRRSSGRNGNTTTRVIVSLVPGAALPPEFKNYVAQ